MLCNNLVECSVIQLTLDSLHRRALPLKTLYPHVQNQLSGIFINLVKRFHVSKSAEALSGHSHAFRLIIDPNFYFKAVRHHERVHLQ